MGDIRYKNLDLELFDYQNDYQKGAGHTEYFRVRVIDSPSGQQKPSDAEKVPLPADVRRWLQMLQDRSLTLSERIERGEVLANLLFPPRARWYLDHSRPDEDERLRIRLRFDNYSLVDLPWEFAYIAKPDTPPGQKGADGFLVLDRKISLVRFEIMGQAMVSVGPVGPGPLRMAILMANPDDPGLMKLNLEAERKSMEEVLREIPIIHPQFCPNATLEKLENALTGDLHAFHFAGHGGFEGDLGATFGSQEGKGFIVLEDEHHRPFKFAAEKLALNLKGRGVRLAVLGSCEGGRRDQVNAWTGVAPALTRAGIPAVVGMQFKVLDENAIAFSRKFYRALAAGESVDAAVTDGRLAIFNRGEDEERDWAVPVLYLRAEEEDGVLFPKAGGSSPQPVAELNRMVARPTPEPEIPRNEDIDQRALRIMMTQHLSPTDLDAVCQTAQNLLKKDGIDLLVNVSMVGGSNLPAQILNLIQYLDRREYLGYLAAALRLERPDKEW